MMAFVRAGEPAPCTPQRQPAACSGHTPSKKRRQRAKIVRTRLWKRCRWCETEEFEPRGAHSDMVDKPNCDHGHLAEQRHVHFGQPEVREFAVEGSHHGSSATSDAASVCSRRSTAAAMKDAVREMRTEMTEELLCLRQSISEDVAREKQQFLDDLQKQSDTGTTAATSVGSHSFSAAAMEDAVSTMRIKVTEEFWDHQQSPSEDASREKHSSSQADLQKPADGPAQAQELLPTLSPEDVLEVSASFPFEDEVWLSLLARLQSSLSNKDKHLRGDCERFLAAYYGKHSAMLTKTYANSPRECVHELKGKLQALRPKIVEAAQLRNDADFERLFFG